MPNHALVACLALLACQVPGGPPSTEGPPPAGSRVLFIGNSFTSYNNLPAMFTAVAEQAGRQRPMAVAVAIPGISLEDHWAEGTARQRLADGRWDFVVLQQGPSTLPESRANLVEWTRNFAPPIRAAGAEPVLYMVWPGLDRIEFTGEGLRSYREAAEAVNGRLAPAGEAWRLAHGAVPEAPVATTDGFHPTVAGTYLAAVVLVCTIYGVAPDALPDTIPGSPLSGAPVAALQRTAATSLVAARE